MESLPNDLCKICHTNPTKYRCPRCSTRTCSLPCTKRHKQWAQCTGQRDPTVYVKRADLTTPHGIDHDYNFLTGIERTIDRAERDVEARGVALHSDGEEERGGAAGWRAQGRHGPKKGEAQLGAALEACGVVVRKAPAGMARGKQNATHWVKKKRTLLWTVEWIRNNGRSELGTCLANAPVSAAYAAHTSPQSGRSNNKRKRESAPPSPIAPPLSSPPRPLPPIETPATSSSPPRPPHFTVKDLHFYLLHPSTPLPTRVLIPLPPTATLDTMLRGRTVLEFPTLYALKYPPEKLPTGFVTFAKYFGAGTGADAEAGGGPELSNSIGVEMSGFGFGGGRDADAWAEGMGGGGLDDYAELDPPEIARGNLDERKLVEVLQRDLGA